jgi:hypothetical protein
MATTSGQIGKRARTSIFNIPNFFTVLLAMVLRFALAVLFITDSLIITAIGYFCDTFISLHIVYLAFSISQPTMFIRRVDDGSGNIKKEVTVVDKYSKVSLLQSVINTIVLVATNFGPFAFVQVIKIIISKIFTSLSSIYWDDVLSHLMLVHERLSQITPSEAEAFLYNYKGYIGTGNHEKDIELLKIFVISECLGFAFDIFTEMIQVLKLVILLKIEERKEADFGAGEGQNWRELVRESLKLFYQIYFTYEGVKGSLKLFLKFLIWKFLFS